MLYVYHISDKINKIKNKSVTDIRFKVAYIIVIISSYNNKFSATYNLLHLWCIIFMYPNIKPILDFNVE